MNAGQYKIKWFYSEDRKTTTRRIYNTQDEVLAESSIKRYVKDPFIKDIARRKSMQKAIDNANTGDTPLFDKAERTILWNGYKDMRPVSKWIKLNN